MASRPMSAPRSRRTEVAPSHLPQPPYPDDEDQDVGIVDDNDADENEVDNDEIDLDSYEAYLAEIQRKAASRPQSARTLRPYPSESPEFYMVTTANPVAPVPSLDLSSITAPPESHNRNKPQAPRVPTRPKSARPRINSGEVSHKTVPIPRAPQTARPSSSGGGGLRRKRQAPPSNSSNADPLSVHVRAAYSRGGGEGKTSSTVISHTAASVIQNRARIFHEAELQHEYNRLVDIVTDLRTVLQHEQTQRLKAMARVRRLEEIVALKDKKIDALLHGHSLGFTTSRTDSDALQREIAQRERQHYTRMQKLRYKLAQQTQLVASYEEAMQALRSSVKSTQLLEMEQELEQWHIENSALNEALAAQSEDIQLYANHVAELQAGDAHIRAQLARAHQELKRSDHERHKLEHETLFLRASVTQLEHKLEAEQKKRSYDQAIATSVGKTSRKSPTIKSPRSVASPSALAEALSDMRMLLAPEAPVSSKPKSPMQQRRPTPMPSFERPTSPMSDDESDTSEKKETVNNEKIHPPRALRKPESSRNKIGKEEKHVRWRSNRDDRDEDSKLESDPHKEQESECHVVRCSIVGDTEKFVQEETESMEKMAEVPSTNDREEQDVEMLGEAPEEAQQIIHESSLLAESSEANETTANRQDQESNRPQHQDDKGPVEGEKSVEDTPTYTPSDVPHLMGATENDQSSETTFSRTDSSDSSVTSHGLGGTTTSSSGSSSLASLLAHEDAALMAAQSVLNDRTCTDDAIPSPDAIGAYDSDFSDNDSV